MLSNSNIRQLIVYDRIKANKKIQSKQYDRIIYKDDEIKVSLPDWWNIPVINSQAKERIGYPHAKAIGAG